MSSNDPAFISPRVKLLLTKRRILIQKAMALEAYSLQVTIDNLIQQNQMNEVRSKNNKHCKSTRQWWKTVNTISGRESKTVFVSSLFSLESDEYFQEINVILTTRLLVTSMPLKVLGSQLSMRSLPLSSFHSKKELPLDLMACYISSTVTSIFNLSIKS